MSVAQSDKDSREIVTDRVNPCDKEEVAYKRNQHAFTRIVCDESFMQSLASLDA